jgi:hypothetical protein
MKGAARGTLHFRAKVVNSSAIIKTQGARNRSDQNYFFDPILPYNDVVICR